MFGPSLPLILAQTPSPISTEWQTGFLGLLLVTLVLLNIWDKLKRKPALDEVFARKSELVDLKSDLTELGVLVSRELRKLDEAFEKRIVAQAEQCDRRIDALDLRREEIERSLAQLVNDQVTQMEKFISKQIADNREINTERYGEMTGKFSSLTTSFQGLSNDLMHQVGRLEGQLLGERTRTT